MRYARLLVLVVVLALCASSSSYAATNAVFPVTASIQQQLELDGWVKEMGPGQIDPGTEGTDRPFPSTMAFGDTSGFLTDELDGGENAGGLYSPTWYAVFLVASTSGRAYKIESSATSFAGVTGSAVGHNLDTSFVLTPAYESADEWVFSSGSLPQGPDPNPGSTVGAQALVVGTHSIYNSGTGGASRIIRAMYSLPPYPDPSDPIATRPSGWDIVDPSKPEGNYEGSVTISLTLTGA